jgi:hypothetical protein
VTRTNNPRSPSFNRPAKCSRYGVTMEELNKQLVEKFREVMLEHYKEVMNYATAEHELKELAELVRLTSAPEKEAHA